MKKKNTPFELQLWGITTLINCHVGSNGIQGSGFFYNEIPSLPPEDDDGQLVKIEGMYLVSNRHVVLPRVNGKEVLPDSFTFNLREIVNNKVEWFPITLQKEQLLERVLLHKDASIDVAIVKVYDLIYSAVSDSQRKFIFPKYLTNDKLPSSSKLKVDVTSDIVVASYPRGFYDELNKFPIVKSGIIASGWNLNFNGRPYFLIDSQLLPGSSGGLVISKPVNLAIIDGKLVGTSEKQFVLLGVYSGNPYKQSQPIEIDDLTIIKKHSFGLGVVWYSHLIPEIIKNGIYLKELNK